MLCGSQSKYARSKMSLLAALTCWHRICTRFSHNAQLTSSSVGSSTHGDRSPCLKRCGCKPTLIALTRCCCIVLWVNWINRGTFSNAHDLYYLHPFKLSVAASCCRIPQTGSLRRRSRLSRQSAFSVPLRPRPKCRGPVWSLQVRLIRFRLCRISGRPLAVSVTK